MKLSLLSCRWLVVVCLAQVPTSRAVTSATDYVEGEVLVRFDASKTLADAEEVAKRHGLTMTRHFDWLSAHEGQVIALLQSPTLNTAGLLVDLQAEPAIALAEPDYWRRVVDLHRPNDSKFGQLWALQNTGQIINGYSGTPGDDISFLKAWGLARPTTNEIVVGVIDTGIDPTHPDLVNNLWTNPGEIPGNGIDDDGNGYVDDVHGYDFSLGTGSLTDSGNHGTHVAGTIAASGNNGLGIIGVNFKAHIMPLKVSLDGSSLMSSAVIEAIQYAAMMKIRGVNVVVLNASYGSGNSSSIERSAMQAAGSDGIIFCAGAGNTANNNDTTHFYPASYRLANMIVVAASDQNDSLASFSDYGPTTVDLAAPGVNILSCRPVAESGYSTYVQQSTNSFSANPLALSGVTSSGGVTGAVYYCGLGYPTNFPAALSNNIALIQRGIIFFSDKVANAMAAGASAAVIFNNVTGNFFGDLQFASNWIPAVAISQADGQTLQDSLPALATVVNAPDPTQVYQFLDGTSMATPHVSGAVAFATMNFPADSVSQRVQRVLTNATPVPALDGKTITGARLNLARIVDSDNNGLPDWWELQNFGQATGTDSSADPDGDGASNLAEFLAGTVPTNFNSALRLSLLTVPGTNLANLRWPSVSGRYYRLLRSTNLLSTFVSTIQTNLIATPPFNTATDVPPVNASSTFYRLQLEP